MALKDTESIMKQLTELKNKVEQELFETAITRGDKDINPFEE